MKKKSAQHQNRFPDWNSPPEVVTIAHKFGQIDIDPCSNAEANKIIQAKKFFTRKQNGLDKEWQGTIWDNPPSSCKNEKGKLTTCRRVVKRNKNGVVKFVESNQCVCSLPKRFWERTAEHILLDRGAWAFYLMFNIEQLDVLSSCESPPHHWQVAFLGRIRYFRAGKEGVAPPHSSALVFLSKDKVLQEKFEKLVGTNRDNSRKKWFMLCEKRGT